MSSKHSWFTYAISRHIPFPWFNWVFTLYLIVCIASFTVINLATTGYNLQTVYTTNPEATLQHRSWFQTPPLSWVNSFSPSCQGTLLSKGDTFFTTNLGLIYTVDRIWQPVNGSNNLMPAISYLNTTLNDCSIDDVDIYFSRREYSPTRSTNGNFWTWDSSYATSQVTCNVTADKQHFNVRFAVSLPPIRLADNDMFLQRIVELNEDTHPSIWWGANLVNIWYTRLAQAMASVQSTPDGSRVDSGQMRVVPNASHTDITSLDFFNQASLVYTNNNSVYLSATPPYNMTLKDLHDNVDDIYPSSLSRISINVDVFAKSFYSLILTDLGQSGRSNAFAPGVNEAEASGIQYLLSALSDVEPHIGGSKNATFVRPHNDILQIDAYNTLRAQIPLRIAPATIFTQYACNIPKLKDTPSLIVSILIADLVLLQVAWMVLKWVVGKYLEDRDPQTMCCEGCLATHNHHATTPKIDVDGPLSLDPEKDGILLNRHPSTTSCISTQPSTSSMSGLATHNPAPSVVTSSIPSKSTRSTGQDITTTSSTTTIQKIAHRTKTY